MSEQEIRAAMAATARLTQEHKDTIKAVRLALEAAPNSEFRVEISIHRMSSDPSDYSRRTYDDAHAMAHKLLHELSLDDLKETESQGVGWFTVQNKYFRANIFYDPSAI